MQSNVTGAAITTKRPYQKPVVRRFPLRPEEAVLGACKNTTSAGPSGGSCKNVTACRVQSS